MSTIINFWLRVCILFLSPSFKSWEQLWSSCKRCQPAGQRQSHSKLCRYPWHLRVAPLRLTACNSAKNRGCVIPFAKVKQRLKGYSIIFFSCSSFDLLAHLQVWHLFCSLLLLLSIYMNGSLEVRLPLLLFPANCTVCCCLPSPLPRHTAPSFSFSL